MSVSEKWMIDPDSYEINSEKYGVKLEFNDVENFDDTSSAAQKFVDYAEEHLGPKNMAEKAIKTILGDLAIIREEDKVFLPERDTEEVRNTLNEWYFMTAGDANYT